jgi:tryptophan-rich sensory protein
MMATTSEIHLPKLLLAIVGCEVAGGLGAIPTGKALATWYPTLAKPSYNPPNWVFGPVWTLLYALMGAALYTISERPDGDSAAVRPAQALFGLQLALNVLWSFLFFGRRAPGAALIELVGLWIAIALTIRAFARVSRFGALLLLPYLAWVSFAAALNFGIWRLNR